MKRIIETAAALRDAANSVVVVAAAIEDGDPGVGGSMLLAKVSELIIEFDCLMQAVLREPYVTGAPSDGL